MYIAALLTHVWQVKPGSSSSRCAVAVAAAVAIAVIGHAGAPVTVHCPSPMLTMYIGNLTGQQVLFNLLAMQFRAEQ